MSRWRPSVAEERWLAVAAQLDDTLPAAALAERSGHWRRTGPLARIALFMLGLVAAAMLVLIVGFDDESTLLVAGLAASLAAEWLTVSKRLHASGFEEGLCLAGFLMIGAWLSTVLHPGPGFGGPAVEPLLIAAAGAAGLRRLNAAVTTAAAIALVYWAGTSAAVRPLDHALGADVPVLVVGAALTLLALVLGARQYRRPAHDRMLDGLVATLPLAAYLKLASWRAFDAYYVAGDAGAGRNTVVLLLLALAAALLVTGLRRRRHAPLWGFLGCIAALAVELRSAIPMAPEAWLIVCGLVALAAGAALDRYLRQPRRGFTSASLTDREGPLDLLQMAGAALLAKDAAPSPARIEPGFEPGGGRFGGGGASGNY